MSNQQSREGEADLKFFLPKRENSTISKTLEVCIEDFLEKLGDAERLADGADIIQLPEVTIGFHQVTFMISKSGIPGKDLEVYLQTSLSPRNKEMNIIQRGILLKACKVEGVCGNLSFEKEEVGICNDPGYACTVETKSIKDLKEAMIASGSHKLDLKITLTIEENEWIVTR